MQLYETIVAARYARRARFMRKMLGGACWLAMAGACQASLIVTASQTCTLPTAGGLLQANTTTGCSLTDTDLGASSGIARATSSGQLTFQPGSNTLTISVEGMVSAIAATDFTCGIFAFCGVAQANASADILFVASSSGPQRSGILSYTSLCSGGPYLGNSSNQTNLIAINGIQKPCAYPAAVSMPIVLGGLLIFEVSGIANAAGSPNDGGATNLGGDIEGSVYEADGITPVALQDAVSPEPSASAITTVGLPLLLIAHSLFAHRSKLSAPRR